MWSSKLFTGGTRIPTYNEIKRPAIFAHRGASAYAPENTLAAFMLAIEQKADGIELDTILSADGEVIVIHDPSVDRTTNGTGSVAAMNLVDLKCLDAGSKFDPRYKGEPIPTLAEVFTAVGNQLVINVELKNYLSPFDELPDRVISLVKKYGLEYSVLLSSFNPLALVRARSILPEIPMGLLTVKGFASLAQRTKLIHFGSDLALHPNIADVTPELIAHAHQLGYRIHAYTAGQTDEMLRMFTMGVDGLFTPDPEAAQSVRASIPITN